MSDIKEGLDYEAIKKSVSVLDVLTEHYKLRGTFALISEELGLYGGRCPICKTGSTEVGDRPFRIMAEENPSSWFCLDCELAGNVFTLVGKMEKADIHESAFLIASWFNLLPETSENGMEKPALQGRGFMRQLDKELKKLLAEGDDYETIRFVKAKVLESYRNGRQVERISP